MIFSEMTFEALPGYSGSSFIAAQPVATTSSNKKSTNKKDSSTTVTSENVDNVDVVIIKITVTNEIIFKEINSKNYSKKTLRILCMLINVFI